MLTIAALVFGFVLGVGASFLFVVVSIARTLLR